MIFRKFIVPDSTVIGLNFQGIEITNTTTLQGVAAETPSGLKVIVLKNSDVAKDYAVSIKNRNGGMLDLTLETRSLTTIVYSD